MKHRKINLVLTLDELIVEVSKKLKKKIFQLFLRFLDHLFIFKKIAFFSRTKHFGMPPL
jgi:hypothetical protein